MIRELEEETGARKIQIEAEMGVYEEYRPAYKKEYDILHMLSYIYKVKCCDEFSEPRFESYEIKNGMKTVWMDIDKAIEHNQKVIDLLDPSMGLSVKRELFLLESIKQEYQYTH